MTTENNTNNTPSNNGEEVVRHSSSTAIEVFADRGSSVTVNTCRCPGHHDGGSKGSGGMTDRNEIITGALGTLGAVLQLLTSAAELAASKDGLTMLLSLL